ncbi:hypothetical protein PHPALM_31929 [Phytophthora palmivora]|uniref:RxLR effector n=1 Tax=Phytophthora palmivora TaxID=4796 RepID=A0A2P4X1C1_9STRA|nr:hypothetical protein PHPALM_31929 [Phytophthora palmivora]
MCIWFIVLVTVTTLLSSSEAIPIPDKANVRNTAVGDEERAVPTVASLEKLDPLPGVIKMFGNRWIFKIMQYNVWIFGNKTPEWVKANFPAYSRGYFLFYHNRMTRGYKYA